MGYFCIDNLPVSLLQPLIGRLAEDQNTSLVAVSIDARNIPVDLQNFPDIISNIDKSFVNHRIVYLDSGNATLVRRFSETRRKHPLSDQVTGLNEALELETTLLDPISSTADLTVDTTRLTIHELRDLIRERITENAHEFALLFQSFAYKNGVPLDADLVFDVRCLPNPHWKQGLRALTGLDLPVIEFLGSEEEVHKMYEDIRGFLTSWLPSFEANNRSYMTVAIGCTGGQHRSVYMSQKLYQTFSPRWKNVQIRHRELSNINT